MKTKLTTPIPVKKVLKKLGKDIREARLRRRIPVALMADRVGISRVTLKSIEDGQPTVSMGLYASALYVLGMLDRLKDIADIAFDTVGQTLSSEELPKRIVTKKE
jgi:DNA-binding XRE family transcriptional regulator